MEKDDYFVLASKKLSNGYFTPNAKRCALFEPFNSLIVCKFI